MSVVVPVLLASSSCGGGSTGFDGNFRGTLDTTQDCPGQTRTTAPAPVSWKLARAAGSDALTVDTGGDCGSFDATAVGDSAASFSPKTCPSGVQLLAGTLRIGDGDLLSVSMSLRSAKGCVVGAVGTLERQ